MWCKITQQKKGHLLIYLLKKTKEWITVKAKIKSIPIGKEKNTNFKAVSKPFHVFATRFVPNTSLNEVKDFVTNQFGAEVTCIKLATKFNSYSSFKITTTNVSQKDVLTWINVLKAF